MEDIREKARLVRGTVSTVQLDLMDGVYVPPHTFPFRSGGKLERSAEEALSTGLPFWEELDYELDLMVARPERFLDLWFQFAPARMIFHFTSVHDWENLIRAAGDSRGLIDFGIAVRNSDTFSEYEGVLESGVFSFVQVMGIGRIGYMGQKFQEETFDTIRRIREAFPELTVSVDGGVSPENICELAEAGASRFVSGSFIFKHGVAAEQVEILEEILTGECDFGSI